MSLKKTQKQTIVVGVLEVKKLVDDDVILQSRIKPEHVESKAQPPSA
jgi:hypothetical protein